MTVRLPRLVARQKSVELDPDESSEPPEPPEPSSSGQSSRGAASSSACTNSTAGWLLPGSLDADDESPPASAVAAQTAATTNAVASSTSSADGLLLWARSISITSFRSSLSGNAAEPERREGAAQEEQDRAGGREDDRQLLLLVIDPDLRADLVVHAPERVPVCRLEEGAAGLLGYLCQGRPVGRDADRAQAAVAVRALHRAVVCPERHRVHRHLRVDRLLGRLERLVVARRVRAVREDEHDDRRVVGLCCG